MLVISSWKLVKANPAWAGGILIQHPNDVHRSLTKVLRGMLIIFALLKNVVEFVQVITQSIMLPSHDSWTSNIFALEINVCGDGAQPYMANGEPMQCAKQTCPANYFCHYGNDDRSTVCCPKKGSRIIASLCNTSRTVRGCRWHLQFTSGLWSWWWQ